VRRLGWIPEAPGAGIDDLDYQRGHRTLKILGNGSEHANYPLDTARALDTYLADGTSGPIFIGVGSGRINRDAADRTLKRLARQAEIPQAILAASLRHSFINAAFDAGVPLRDVMEAASLADMWLT
jgi:integrase/recombinase XerD